MAGGGVGARRAVRRTRDCGFGRVGYFVATPVHYAAENEQCAAARPTGHFIRSAGTDREARGNWPLISIACGMTPAIRLLRRPVAPNCFCVADQPSLLQRTCDPEDVLDRLIEGYLPSGAGGRAAPAGKLMSEIENVVCSKHARGIEASERRMAAAGGERPMAVWGGRSRH